MAGCCSASIALAYWSIKYPLTVLVYTRVSLFLPRAARVRVAATRPERVPTGSLPGGDRGSPPQHVPGPWNHHLRVGPACWPACHSHMPVVARTAVGVMRLRARSGLPVLSKTRSSRLQL
jgi:hypothetical protein